jgi:LPPG:FO 2-phospho-L-lactate transferase
LKVTALAGGVGAARFLTGLVHQIPPENLTVIANTGDDIELYGLHISPDVDIVAYTLAGIVDESKGWGIKGDSFHFLDTLKSYGVDAWFNLGDRDLATHVYRTTRLNAGKSLKEVTNEICRMLNLKTKILPMTNNRFETQIKTPVGVMHLEEYFVKHQCRPEVLGVTFEGADSAKATPGVFDAISEANIVIICPSNPIVSIGTILSVAGVREALRQAHGRVVGVSPIVAGVTIKGPADKMMRALGHEASAWGAAELYRDFLDAFVIDSKDACEAERIRLLGVDVAVTNTVMRSLSDKAELAKAVLDA